MQELQDSVIVVLPFCEEGIDYGFKLSEIFFFPFEKPVSNGLCLVCRDFSRCKIFSVSI